MGFQRLSAESRHNPVVAADGNAPPFFHAVGACFRQIHTKSVCFMAQFPASLSSLYALFVANLHKCLSINNLQLFSVVSNQGQSCLIVPNRVIRVLKVAVLDESKWQGMD
jgi:hypothetical protein